jgi:type IV secretory pathway VirB10-like protein
MPPPVNNGTAPPQQPAPPYSVRRVNSVPLMIGFGLVATFVAIVFLVVLPGNDSGKKETKTKIVSAAGEAANVNADAPIGFVPPRSTPTPPAAPGPTPEPVGYRLPSAPQPTPDDRIATLKEALSFRTRSVNIEHPVAYQAPPAPAPMATPEAMATPENYEGLLQRARALRQGGIGTPEEKKEATALGNALASANYGADNPDRWHSPNQVENPVRYQLRAGFVIPAVLLSGINSEVPGTIIGQVAQNVYDNATGSDLLIPQGARLIGSYSSNVQYGQSRLFVVWQRIDFPDGRALDIGAEPGTDSAGYAGFKDQVDSHWLRIFGSAVMMSAISAGISSSQDRYQQGNGNYYAPPNFSGELSQAVGQQFGQAAAKLLEKNLDVAPTLKIRPGYRFSILLIKDFVFPGPYQDFAYPRARARNQASLPPVPAE